MFALRVVGRLFNRLLTGGVHTLVRHPISTVIIFVLLGLVFLMLNSLQPAQGDAVAQTSLASTSSQRASASTNVTRSSATSGNASAPTAAEQYIEGYRTYNAQLIWDAMGDDMKTQATKNGESIDTMQKRMDDAKKAGRSVQTSEFIALYDTKDGRAIAFYVVTLRDEASGQIAHTPFTFYLGTDGKLLTVQ